MLGAGFCNLSADLFCTWKPEVLLEALREKERLRFTMGKTNQFMLEFSSEVIGSTHKMRLHA
jgi:hypothetical protein